MEWVRSEVIGHGSFGSVNLAVPRKQSTKIPHLMAVKSCGSSHASFLMNEKSILEQLRDCPQIIKCFGGDFCFENGENLFNLLLEYAPGGNLAEKIKNSSSGRLSETEVQRYTKSVLKGLHYTHKIGFVHCDVKLQNILLCSSNQGDVAKIADFGLAKKIGLKKEKAGFEIRGTPLYMAPETVFTGDIEPPADVWGLGCLVAEMVTGAPVWRCSPDDDVCHLLMRIGTGDEIPEIPESLSAEGKDFLVRCFMKDPWKRWTTGMLLNHPFMVDQADDEDEDEDKDEDRTSSSCRSPIVPFDFPDWDSPCSITATFSTAEYSWKPDTVSSNELNFSSNSPAGERLRTLAIEKRPDWSVSGSWVSVR